MKDKQESGQKHNHKQVQVHHLPVIVKKEVGYKRACVKNKFMYIDCRQENSNMPILAAWIVNLVSAIIGSLFITLSSMQSPLLTLMQKKLSDEQVLSATISLLSISLHFVLTIFAYLAQPPEKIKKIVEEQGLVDVVVDEIKESK